MDRADLERLLKIIRYCIKISSTIERFGNSFEVFEENYDFFQSVSMSLQQIGELASTLSNSFKDSTRERISWGMIRGMRNRFAHGYDQMNKKQIWETATKDAPILL
jgi:uncharacterized protein with HEPN domain